MFVNLFAEFVSPSFLINDLTEFRESVIVKFCIFYLNISNLSVKSDNQVKYLGLIFDSNLNWKPYLHELSKKISRGIGWGTI